MMPAENGNEPQQVLARMDGEAIVNAEGLLTISSEEREERSYPIPAARNIVVTQGQQDSGRNANHAPASAIHRMSCASRAARRCRSTW